MAKRPPKHPRTPFGQRLEAVRIMLYQDAAPFARALGVTPQRYANWLVGKGHPDLPLLARIREIAGVDLNFLITGKPSPAPAEAPHITKKLIKTA